MSLTNTEKARLLMAIADAKEIKKELEVYHNNDYTAHLIKLSNAVSEIAEILLKDSLS